RPPPPPAGQPPPLPDHRVSRSMAPGGPPATSGSARNRNVLDDRADDRLGALPRPVGGGTHQEDAVRQGGNRQALDVVGHEVVPPVGQRVGPSRSERRAGPAR